MKKKVLIRGPILTQSGYGVHARTLYRALKEREDLFDLYIQPINWGQTSWAWEDTQERREIDQLVGKTAQYMQGNVVFDIALLVTIPNEWERIAPLTIGVTAGIETNKVAPNWLEKANSTVDKIIVVSTFAKHVFENTLYRAVDNQTKQERVLKLDVPISVVNYPVKKFNKINLGFDLDYDFNFLTVAQWGPRKNIKNTLKWFIEEFFDQEVGLVLKVNRKNNSVIDRKHVEIEIKNILKEYPDRKCKIYLLHGYMSQDEVHSLYCHPKIKVLLSLTHGEGYGLPLFEAAYTGLPIISHEWGGQTDFLFVKEKNKKGKFKNKNLFAKVDYDLKQIQKDAVWDGVLQADSQWAFPRQGSVKMKMREVYKNYHIYSGQAKRLKKHVIKGFSEKSIHNNFIEAIFDESFNTDNIKYVFVSDMFASQWKGGAEFSLQALINNCKDEYVTLNSRDLDEYKIERYKDKIWVFGNNTQINPALYEKFAQGDIKYYMIEFDYKFCKYRNLDLHKTLESSDCNCSGTEHGQRVEDFFIAAQKIFFMSKRQMDIHLEKLKKLKPQSCMVLSSVFDDEFFDTIRRLREQYIEKKNKKWAISGAPMWVKGAETAEEWCKENNKEYVKLFNVPYEETLRTLAESKGVCFLPAGADTCPRFVIEAKLLGCELELNEHVQHKDEEWFNTESLEEIEDYLRETPERFWGAISA